MTVPVGVGAEAGPRPALGDGLELLEHRDVQPAGSVESGVERPPRRLRGWCDQRRPCRHEPLGRRPGVGDLEGDAQPRRCVMADLDLVDHAFLCRVGDLQRRSAGIENGDPGLPLVLERELFGQSQHVTVEGNRLVVVLRLDDETELQDSPVIWCVTVHRPSR